jgi:hypothetical protein
VIDPVTASGSCWYCAAKSSGVRLPDKLAQCFDQCCSRADLLGVEAIVEASKRAPVTIFDMRVSGYSHKWTRIKGLKRELRVGCQRS